VKVLVAVLSCAKHLNRNTACLETWASNAYLAPAPERGIFAALPLPFGKNGSHVSLGLFTGKDLETGDEYVDLPAKIKSLCDFAIDDDFDWLFKCDSDTFVWLDRLLASGFEQFDYIGWAGGVVEPAQEYASGGAGYWLSRKAFEIVAKAPLTSDTCEDRWVGRVLFDAGIIVHRDVRYAHGRHDEIATNKELLTMHPCSPAMMYKIWKENRI